MFTILYLQTNSNIPWDFELKYPIKDLPSGYTSLNTEVCDFHIYTTYMGRKSYSSRINF